MHRRLNVLVGLSAAAFCAIAPLSFAQDQNKPPMHMHKSEMDHRSDQDVATEFKSEANQLREKAASHRKLAEAYRTRTPPKGNAGYANVAKHCDKLAQYYENAAKEADGVATELNK